MTYQYKDLTVHYEITRQGIQFVEPFITDEAGEFVSINMKEQSVIKDRIRDEVSSN